MTEKEATSGLPLSSYMECCLATADDISKISNTLLTLCTGGIALVIGFVKVPGIPGMLGHVMSVFYGLTSGFLLSSLFLWLQVSQHVLKVRTLAIARNESAIIGSRPLDKELTTLLALFKWQQTSFLGAALTATVLVFIIHGLNWAKLPAN